MGSTQFPQCRYNILLSYFKSNARTISVLLDNLIVLRYNSFIYFSEFLNKYFFTSAEGRSSQNISAALISKPAVKIVSNIWPTYPSDIIWGLMTKQEQFEKQAGVCNPDFPKKNSSYLAAPAEFSLPQTPGLESSLPNSRLKDPTISFILVKQLSESTSIARTRSEVTKLTNYARKGFPRYCSKIRQAYCFDSLASFRLEMVSPFSSIALRIFPKERYASGVTKRSPLHYIGFTLIFELRISFQQTHQQSRLF